MLKICFYSFKNRHFGEASAKAMDTTWYKRAVDHHTIEPDSFVFSVPIDSGYTGKANATLVTAAHAIFIDHRGHNKAPAAVVGLQYQHDSLARHFRNITSACTGTGHCRKTCATEELDCYVLDNNGFVIISESTEHTGKFFGQIDGTIMDSLVQDRIYRRVTLMNYQGLCSDRDNPYTAAGDVTTRPNRHFAQLFNTIVSLATAWISMFPNPVQAWPHYSEQYMDRNFGEDSDDSSYPEEYDDEVLDAVDNNVEHTTEHGVRVQLANVRNRNCVIFERFFDFIFYFFIFVSSIFRMILRKSQLPHRNQLQHQHQRQKLFPIHHLHGHAI